MLGEADVNISAMHLARTRPREDALMILALDDDVPAGVAEAIRAHENVTRPLDDPARERALSGSPIPAGLDATLVLVRHGESEFIVEGRFQGQAETPAVGDRPAPGRAGRRAARRPGRSPALPIPAGPPLEIVHSPLGRAAETAAADRGRPIRRPRRPVRPDAGFAEIGQGEWEGLHRDEIAARYADDARRLAAPRRPRSGRPAASRSAEVADARPRPAWPRSSRGLADGRGRRPREPVAGYAGARPDGPVEHRRRPRRRLQGRRC